MTERKKKIKAAIRLAKKRDKNRCVVCGQSPVDGAHLLPRNVAFVRYVPWDADNIISLCRPHHREYDIHHWPHDKIRWLEQKGLYDASRRVEYLIGERKCPGRIFYVEEGLAVK